MSEQVWIDLALVAAIVPVVAWLLLRDLKRAVHRRRMRQLLAPLAASFDALKATVGLALVPGLRQAVVAAAEMDRSMRKLQATLSAAGSVTMADLQRFAERVQPPADHGDGSGAGGREGGEGA